VELKTEADLEKIRRAGKIVAGLLKLLETQIQPGIQTKELDRNAEKFIRDHKAEPAFKGYFGYPASICTSVNEEVVHGIPGERRLAEGDIVGIDVGVKLDGFYGDAARTFAVGTIDRESRKLMEITRQALAEGIAKAVQGNRLTDISWAVQSYAERAGVSVVRQFVGHGIGRNLHEEPQVPNYGKPNRGPELKVGMALAIEPMLNLGTYEVEVLSDGWTVVTRDRKRSAHFEDTVLVGAEQAEIVT